MIFLCKWVIFRWTMLIFSGVKSLSSNLFQQNSSLHHQLLSSSAPRLSPKTLFAPKGTRPSTVARSKVVAPVCDRFTGSWFDDVDFFSLRDSWRYKFLDQICCIHLRQMIQPPSLRVSNWKLVAFFGENRHVRLGKGHGIAVEVALGVTFEGCQCGFRKSKLWMWMKHHQCGINGGSFTLADNQLQTVEYNIYIYNLISEWQCWPGS